MTIFCKDLASVIESIYTKEILSWNPIDSDIFVNPDNDLLINKTIIINNYLPRGLNINKLSKNNKIISRFPIDCDNYELDPYIDKLPSRKLKISDKVCSVLSEFTFDTEVFDFKKGILTLPKFQLVTNSEVNGYKTVTGLVADSMGTVTNWKSFYSFINSSMQKYKDVTKLFDDNSVYRKTLKTETNSFDICTENEYFRGPLIRKRRPDKRMNVKNGYFYGKFKTYRATDKFRSFDINYNLRDGFHLFYTNKMELDFSDVSTLVNNGGLDFTLYLLFYFCKKNHFKSITGDTLTEPLQFLIDPKGMMNLHLTYFPNGLVDDNDTFHLSLLGMSKYII